MDIITPRDFEDFDQLVQRGKLFSPMHPFINMLSIEDCIVHKNIAVEQTTNRLKVHSSDLEFLKQL